MPGAVLLMTREAESRLVTQQLGLVTEITACHFDAIRQTSTLEIRMVAVWNAFCEIPLSKQKRTENIVPKSTCE